MFVIGTAGHVDHGKSTLVRALTGIDPDRLREEKERGLTIDLGFAWLTLPSGREVSIVDVPGHERFIKNMLAGAGGVDLALLIVAADEGLMPQTREHLAILDLLDVHAGIVVITKTDLVEPGYAALVEEEFRETLDGTILQGAPTVHVSAATGDGIPALLAAIDTALDTMPPRRDLGRPRVPIDRAFTIQGFGTVVTGTLLDGSLHVGQEVELQPAGLRARIRGLQRHKTKVASLEPGTRAAINLSGIHAEDVQRGYVLALPVALPTATVVDLRLRATPILSHPVAHDAGVTFLSGTSESEAKLRLLDRDTLLPGEECWAQAVLESPVAILRGDRAIIRTANETVGGGTVVAINPRKHRRNHPPTLEVLQRQLAGTPADRLQDLLLSGPLTPAEAATALHLPPEDFAAALAEALADGTVTHFGDRLASTLWRHSATSRLLAAIESYLQANPLRFGAPREHVRSAATFAPATFDLLIAELLSEGTLHERAAALTPAGYAPTLTPAQRQQADAYLAALRSGRFSPPTDAPPPAPLLAHLVEGGLVEDAGSGVVFAAEVFTEMLTAVRAHFATNETLSLAETRDLFATSRKYAQAFLEHLDDTRVTRRLGDTRVIR